MFTKPVLRLVLQCLLLIFALHSAVQAQDIQSEPSSFASHWPAMCKGMVAEFLSPPGFQSVLDLAPVSDVAVCECAERRLRTDLHLGVLFVGDLDGHLRLVDGENFEPYFKGKLLAYSLTCLGQEVERSTAGINLAVGD